jgi:type IX secretion system PorP/SprF family membrane protein
MGKLIITVSFTLLAYAVTAQYFQYSQYNYAQQRINPAMVASSNYASLGMLYRHQTAGGNVNLKSSIISGVLPLLSLKTGMRWSGIGISLMDDRAGGIFATQEASLSYAVNIFLNRFQTLSLGFKGLYQQRNVNLDGLYTGSQYIPDRGFDGSLFNGENIQFLKSNFFTFSTGLHWQQNDRDGERVAYWGVSLFDFNQPEASFSGMKSQLNATFIFSGGVRVYESRELSVTPEMLLTHSASTNALNIGSVTAYKLKSLPNRIPDKINIITKYVVGRSGIIGLQLCRENFSIGCSYDFPVLKQNMGNIGAFEVGLELRRLVDPKARKKLTVRRKVPTTTRQSVSKTPEKKINKNAVTSKPAASVADSIRRKPKTRTDLKTTLRQKQDSAVASAEAGDMQHQPLVIEKINLHFNFEFNSSDLDEESLQYLDDLATALKANERLKIKLTGHTDNIGSAKFNQRLSLFRANTIKEYLVKREIPPERIETEGKGLTEPLNENKTVEEQAKNRRVELKILYEN